MVDGQGAFLLRVYARIAGTYERANRLLTLGLDRRWRRRAVRLAVAGGGRDWLDVCTGTGETAAALARLAPPGTRVHAADFSEAMLAVARRKPGAERVAFHLAEAGALPFADGSMDLVTVSFATRNLDAGREALVRRFAEIRRVLRPGGRFVSVESSQPPWRVVRACRDRYVRLAVRALGRRPSGCDDGYAYLASSIRRFRPAEELALLLEEAGFTDVRLRRLLFGAAAVHLAVKRGGARGT